MPDDAATSGGEADAPADVVYLRRIQSPAQVERIALIAGLIAARMLAVISARRLRFSLRRGNVVGLLSGAWLADRKRHV